MASYQPAAALSESGSGVGGCVRLPESVLGRLQVVREMKDVFVGTMCVLERLYISWGTMLDFCWVFMHVFF